MLRGVIRALAERDARPKERGLRSEVHVSHGAGRMSRLRQACLDTCARYLTDAGLGRESLYKALAPGAKPRFDTVLKVARALGIRLSAHVV